MLNRRQTRPRHRRPDEQGSIIVALLVIFVVVGLSSVLAARVIGNETIVVHRQNTAAGIAGADAGITDALFRIDQGAAGTGTVTGSPIGNYQFCVGGTGCIAPSVPGAPGVKYIATANTSNPSTATQWTVQSKGTVNGAPGAIQETLTRISEYQYALFGATTLDFNGKSVNGFGNYSPGSQASGNPQACADAAVNPACVKIGSNGIINCPGTSHSSNSDLPLSVLAVYYSGGGGVSGPCGTTQPVSTLFNVPVQSPPAGTWTCPGNGQLGSNTTGPATIGTPGQTTVYVCNNTSVTISGNLQVVGPVQFYIQLDSSTNQSFVSSKTPTLEITAGSTVNTSINTNPAPSSAQLPDASLFQVFSNSSGTIGSTNGSAAAYYYGGTMYAPNATLTGNGCASSFYGSLVLNKFVCNGGPALTINYDKDLANLFGPWSTSGYVQIPPATLPSF
jgi:hypothetical protein